MMRRFMLNTLNYAMVQLYEYEIKHLNRRIGEIKEGKPINILTNFINAFIVCIYEPKKASYRDYTEFFQMFNRFSNLGEDCVLYLLKSKILGRFMDFFYENNQQDLRKIFRDFSDIPHVNPEDHLMGQPTLGNSFWRINAKF